MRRILFMHQASTVGGGSYCLLNIVKALDKTLWEPIVALQSHGPLEDEFKKLDVKVVIFPQMANIPYNHPLTPRNLLIYWRVLRSEKNCLELLQRELIDVLYLNNMMLAPYLRAAKKAGCKTVMHVREHWPLDEHQKQLEWIRKIVYENCDKLIAINQYSASIFPKIDSTIVYDWIDMSNRYKPMPMNEIFGEDVNGKKVLLYTGGFLRIKGTDYVVNAFKENVKGDDYKLLILGTDMNRPLVGTRHRIKSLLSHFGYRYYEQEMRNLVKTDSRIYCIPGVYELKHLVEQSYCFVSYFRMPHANLAMAENIILGNPCIAADSEEAREYTDNGKYAMLVKANDPDLFAQKLCVFLAENDQWRLAAQSGSEAVSKKFDKEINIKVLNDALRGL